MRSRYERSHPAVKHGGYATTTILPGESVADFKKLLTDLIDEFNPDGALEYDIVVNMARLVWRKQNLKTFSAAEWARVRYQQVLERALEHSKWFRKRDFPIPTPYYDESELPPCLGKLEDLLDEDIKEMKVIHDIVRKELGEDTYNLAMINTATGRGSAERLGCPRPIGRSDR